MSWINDNVLLIVSILLVLIIIEGLIIYFLPKKKTKSKGRSKSGSVSIEKYEKACNDRNDYREKCEQLRNNYRKKEKECGDYFIKLSRCKGENDKLLDENNTLKQKLKDERDYLEQKIEELNRENDELRKKVIGNELSPNVPETAAKDSSTTVIPKAKEELVDNAPSKSSQSPVQEVVSTGGAQMANSPKEEPKNNPIKEESKKDSAVEEPKNEPSKDETSKAEPKVETSEEKTMYASFPRSAGSSIYFSDLSENLVEDSFFELKISITSGKATFKPLDFMKIRNYDPAMAAMCTEGVKPNVASAVQGIEHGKAHIEGKDWIIDNPAKIKLA